MTDPERVEAVAEALHIVGTRPGFTEMDAWTRWTTLAAAAIAALPPSPAEEAVKRVEALADWYDGGGEGVPRLPGRGATSNAYAANRIRAALAPPAPAPQGEEPTCYCGRLGHRLGGPILHTRTEECPR